MQRVEVSQRNLGHARSERTDATDNRRSAAVRHENPRSMPPLDLRHILSFNLSLPPDPCHGFLCFPSFRPPDRRGVIPTATSRKRQRRVLFRR